LKTSICVPVTVSDQNMFEFTGKT